MKRDGVEGGLGVAMLPELLVASLTRELTARLFETVTQQLIFKMSCTFDPELHR